MQDEKMVVLRDASFNIEISRDEAEELIKAIDEAKGEDSLFTFKSGDSINTRRVEGIITKELYSSDRFFDPNQKPLIAFTV